MLFLCGRQRTGVEKGDPRLTRNEGLPRGREVVDGVVGDPQVYHLVRGNVVER